MLPPNFRSFYLFRKGEYKYLLSGEKNQTKPNQKTPNATVPLFCTSSKSLQMTYREIKSHLPNDSVLLKINRTSATLSLKGTRLVLLLLNIVFQLGIEKR